MIKTAVVILNWNGSGFLKMFLKNTLEKSADPGTKIYVADNGSTDGSCEWIEENHREVNLLRFDKNHGFAGGYNLALSEIEAQYYILLNSDIEVTEGWLEPLISYMDSNTDVAACQPLILSFDRKDHFEYAGAAGGYIDKYGYPFCRGRILSHVEVNNGQYDSLADVFWASGACMVVRASAWKECGGFDADFFAHMEEIDLCWRFHRTGYRVAFIPDSKVYHVGGGSLPYNSPFKTYLNFRNSIYLLFKNLPERKFSRILFIRKILDGLAAIFFLMKGDLKNFIAVWKAHRHAVRERTSLIEKRARVRSLGNRDPENLILNKSIVYEFYVKRKKTYNNIIHEIPIK